MGQCAMLWHLLRSNATHVVTGHADGCVRWHVLEHPASTRTQARLTLQPVMDNSYCPDSVTPEPDASIKLITLGKVYPKQRKLAAVAVTEANAVLMLRDKGRPPIAASGTSAIHHVQLEHRQVWHCRRSRHGSACVLDRHAIHLSMDKACD